MSKRIFLLLCAFYSLTAMAGSQLSENQKLESLAKLWGFLKYYHPKVAKGKLNWDEELARKIVEVRTAKDRQELNAIYSQWLDELGKVRRCHGCDNNVPDSLMRNVTFGWLYDSTVFDAELIQKLDYLRKNRNQGKNHYVQRRYPLFKVQAYFKNEKAYEELEPLPSEEFRLLGLFRYWNIINYYFPYKYAIGESWDSVLADMLPKFRNAASPVEYHMAMNELIVRINDGHASFGTKYTMQYFGIYHVPFEFKLIDGKAIVTGFYNQDLASANGISYGDVITEVNGQPVSEVLEPKLKYIPGSNTAYKLNNAWNAVFNGHSDTVNITIEKNGLEQQRRIRRYLFHRFNYKPDTTHVQPWQMLHNNNVGYIDMSRLTAKDVSQAMQELQATKGLVIDLRKYPKPVSHAVAAHLKPAKSSHALLTYPDLNYPGVFKPKVPWKTGSKNNKDYYKGKVVVLVNENTISAGEFACMALQTAPDVTVMGSQTAGADGNIVKIIFPGGFKTIMSGLGIYYPDGRETQRIGIVPDIIVNPTIEGIQKREDEVLNRAIQFINAASL